MRIICMSFQITTWTREGHWINTPTSNCRWSYEMEEGDEKKLENSIVMWEHWQRYKCENVKGALPKQKRRFVVATHCLTIAQQKNVFINHQWVRWLLTICPYCHPKIYVYARLLPPTLVQLLKYCKWWRYFRSNVIRCGKENKYDDEKFTWLFPNADSSSCWKCEKLAKSATPKWINVDLNQHTRHRHTNRLIFSPVIVKLIVSCLMLFTMCAHYTPASAPRNSMQKHLKIFDLNSSKINKW